MAQRRKTRPRREWAPTATVAGRSVPLRTLTEQALDNYFTALNGHAPGHLYELVLRKVPRLMPRISAARLWFHAA